MPNYAIINFKNLYTTAGIRAVQGEALREQEYSNVDSDRSENNEILLGDGNYLNLYYSAVRSDYYTVPDKKGQLHKEPKIKGVGIIMTYSPEASIEEDPEAFERWKQKNLEYLEKLFPGCPKTAILHLDETTPHIHCFVVPQVKETGKIVKTKFLNGRNDYYKQQTEYPNEMAEFGLVRGKHRPPREAEEFDKNELKQYRSLVNKIKKLQRTIIEKEDYISQITREAEIKNMEIQKYEEKIEFLKDEIEKMESGERAKEILERIFPSSDSKFFEDFEK